ncbi:hypothetical protein NPIL_37621 [Nephila pilipes]|uniref:Uncharacterized protein n=1 Tax=Nephila pilipes TaxID=299642 RepID=A0A8X6NP69_NEPPI|nr:hypothetical protein NPIL_37621 [Nephila pilipes]
MVDVRFTLAPRFILSLLRQIRSTNDIQCLLEDSIWYGVKAGADVSDSMRFFNADSPVIGSGTNYPQSNPAIRNRITYCHRVYLNENVTLLLVE